MLISVLWEHMLQCFGLMLQGSGQEKNDIEELEDAWLSAQGRRRCQDATRSQAAGANNDATQSKTFVCTMADLYVGRTAVPLDCSASGIHALHFAPGLCTGVIAY